MAIAFKMTFEEAYLLLSSGFLPTSTGTYTAYPTYEQARQPRSSEEQQFVIGFVLPEAVRYFIQIKKLGAMRGQRADQLLFEMTSAP